MDSDDENKPSGARRGARDQGCDNKRAGTWGIVCLCTSVSA